MKQAHSQADYKNVRRKLYSNKNWPKFKKKMSDPVFSGRMETSI